MSQTNCQAELLTLYHYDELDEALRHQVEEHLAGCSNCRTRLEQLSRTLQQVETDRLQLSNLERRRFVQQVAAASRKRPSLRLPAWGLALSSAAALGLTLFLLRPGIAPQQPQHQGRIFAEIEVLQDFELLNDLDLLEDLDLLQEMEDLG